MSGPPGSRSSSSVNMPTPHASSGGDTTRGMPPWSTVRKARGSEYVPGAATLSTSCPFTEYTTSLAELTKKSPPQPSNGTTVLADGEMAP